MDQCSAKNPSTIAPSEEKQISAPFFSIGVTTYNRHELLKQTLLSISAQTFTDFEVIVGNDYTQETLSAEMLGIDDPRIRFVNYPENLGELGNMNALLAMARGRYFTWQSDDDLYEADFLHAIHSALIKYNFPLAAFGSYRNVYEIGEKMPLLNLSEVKSRPIHMKVFSGRQFLRLYLSGKLKALGLCGAFDIEYLRRTGGVEQLCESHYALYSEHLLLVRAGLLEKVAYIDTPLVNYRVHAGSWGSTTTDLELHAQAGRTLVGKSAVVLRHPVLQDNFQRNISAIYKLAFRKYVERCAMLDGFACVRKAIAYLNSLNDSLKSAAEMPPCRVKYPSMYQAIMWFIVPYLEWRFKTKASPFLLRIAYRIYSFFRKHGWVRSIP
ncbi:MAG: hypothetical protein C0410_12950 [Anaerolinea sp.]|nr:hypothetical protein [Anaerolinea sp.]